jgi:hypothetical protein
MPRHVSSIRPPVEEKPKIRFNFLEKNCVIDSYQSYAKEGFVDSLIQKKIGNLFSPLQVDRVIQLVEQYKDRPVNPYAVHSLGIDPGFGSSKTAIVLTELLKEEQVIRVLYAEEFERPNPSQIADIAFDIYRKNWNT